ncbi:hypothetical protein EYM_02720 [Ignicoccus islandicus DSM 13165]|uniref:HD Cas3-type domain-containing protein n=1 Tax=Ignicoccus islandicus DSM 13165 TaxID=940295 RepID=A0A0U3FPY1_9CREN|nr:CRISPR-associated endonuclease Cas3'' [Ignicoccus islandicus]ALU12351.1 hypothetical protein EYM_02720 [Ignicoccus islandicus DSM 13165]
MVWPIAYAEGNRVEPLEDHLLRTAFITLRVFERELEYLQKERSTVLKIATLSALFHDLGKANERSYERYVKGDDKVSFKCHEVLSFLILKEMEYNKVYKELGLERNDWMVIEYSVLNHHHAMRMVSECLLDERSIYKAIGLERMKLWKVLRIESPESKDYWSIGGYSARDVLQNFVNRDVYQMGPYYLKLSYVMSGLISLADSLAAFLYRGELRDTPQTPSKYIRLSLRERGYDVDEFLSKYSWLNNVNPQELYRYVLSASF